MSQKTKHLKNAFRRLVPERWEITSGTVVAGSRDTAAHTISVQTDDDTVLTDVRLNAITGTSEGMLVYPKDGSLVIAGSIDGPGEWVVLQTAEIDEVTVTIGSIQVRLTESSINLMNGNTHVDITSSVLKLKTASESLYQLLKDLLTYLQALTVSTSGGPSGTPLNISDFITLQTRLDNLLAA